MPGDVMETSKKEQDQEGGRNHRSDYDRVTKKITAGRKASFARGPATTDFQKRGKESTRGKDSKVLLDRVGTKKEKHFRDLTLPEGKNDKTP